MKKFLIFLITLNLSVVSFALTCPDPSTITLQSKSWRADIPKPKNLPNYIRFDSFTGDQNDNSNKVVAFTGATAISGFQYTVLEACYYTTVNTSTNVKGQIQLKSDTTFHVVTSKGNWKGSYTCKGTQVTDCPFGFGS